MGLNAGDYHDTDTAECEKNKLQRRLHVFCHREALMSIEGLWSNNVTGAARPQGDPREPAFLPRIPKSGEGWLGCRCRGVGVYTTLNHLWG